MVKLRDYNARAVGVSWFREEDYAAARALFDATDKLPPWEQWLKAAKELEQNFLSEGYIVERVYIDPDTFPDWCRERGLRIDRHARTRFSAEAVNAKYGKNQS
jgi:hypothetical protein